MLINETQKLRIGILGAASIVPRFVEGVEASDVAEVVAIAARKRQKADQMAEKIGVKEVYEDYQSLCHQADVDLVYIPIYNRGHFDAAKLALETNHHVLLEKPFTLTLMEADYFLILYKLNRNLLCKLKRRFFCP